MGVNFEAHARPLGAQAETVANATELVEAFKRAKFSDKTSVIVTQVDAYDGWTTEGHTRWECSSPSVSDSQKVRNAHVEWESSRHKQRKGV